MEKQVAAFFRLVQDFRKNRHDLLAFESNDFDRRFLEFNSQVLILEGELQVHVSAHTRVRTWVFPVQGSTRGLLAPAREAARCSSAAPRFCAV